MPDKLDDIVASLNAESAALVEKLRQMDALRIIQKIGTAPDVMLANIASIAAQICEVPVSTITLIDDEKQYIKGMIGMDESCRVLNRFEGICNLTIQCPDANTIIYDASEDIRVKGLPVVNGTYDYIKFYAGMPIVTKAGYAIGSMCVIDRIPRKLRKDQLVAVEKLRDLVVYLMEG